MYEGKKQYYHALDRACIDSLDCDIPLNIGFNILRYVRSPEYRYFTFQIRHRHRLVPRLSNSRRKVRKIGISRRPSYLTSNAGAGYR